MNKIQKFLQFQEIMVNPEVLIYSKLNIGQFYKMALLKNGMAIWFEKGSEAVFMMYEIFIMKPYTKHFQIEKNDVVMDIGANRGFFCLFASEKAKKVYAYEPVDSTYELLDTNITYNSIKNVYAKKAGISNYTGNAIINKSKKHSGTSSLYLHVEQEEKEKIKVLEINDELRKVGYVDFLKIDCEGSEYDIIYAIRQFKYIKKIALEFHEIDERTKNGKALFQYLSCHYKHVIKEGEGERGMIYAWDYGIDI